MLLLISFLGEQARHSQRFASAWSGGVAEKTRLAPSGVCPTLHPSPHTLHPTPHTLHPTPCTLHPTPHTPHPIPHTLHPTPYTLHPTPYTLHPSSCTLSACIRKDKLQVSGRFFWCLSLRSDDAFQETSARYRTVEPEQWLQRHPEAGSSWPSWLRSSYILFIVFKP